MEKSKDSIVILGYNDNVLKNKRNREHLRYYIVKKKQCMYQYFLMTILM